MTDRKLARLLDMRQGDEDKAAKAESYFGSNFTEGAPTTPGAQLVYSPAGPIGVAVEGARFVCPLPKNYTGPHVALDRLSEHHYRVTCPGLPPLLIDGQNGTTRAL